MGRGKWVTEPTPIAAVGFISLTSMLLVLLALIHLVCATKGISSGKASEFYVQGLPDYEGEDLPTMHAGKIDAGSGVGMGERSLFFWHVQAEKNTHTTILWLNGGPGCSSLDGGLLEVGPFRFNASNKQMYRSNDSWSSFANMLFLDQPFGTGFSDPVETESRGGYLHTLENTAKVVVQFLYEYAKVFPEIRNTKIYLAGESFAGQYIPHVWQELKNRPEVINEIDSVHHVGVHGAMLIAPWIDPAHQYLSQALFAKQNELIDSKYFEVLDQLHGQCLSSLERGVSLNNRECEMVDNFILQYSAGGPGKDECINIYDVSQVSPYPSCGAEWPYELPHVNDYLQREDVQKALHAVPADGVPKWTECSNKVHTALSKGRIASEFIGDLIRDIPLMIIAGTNDYICNYLGLESFIYSLEWNDIQGFQGLSTDTDYGSYQSERNLTFVKVENGTHMLPVEHLQLSGELARQFIGVEAPKDHASPPPVDSQPSESEQESGDKPSEKPNDNEDAINDAVYRAYRQAGVVALIVVILVFAVLGVVYWYRGSKISGRGLLKALLQVGRSRDNKFDRDSVPLRTMRRRPSVIPEEDEEEEESFEV